MKPRVRLRPTRESDLDFVLRLEADPENSPFVGSWTRDEHRAAIEADDREHWIVEALDPVRPAGYLIAFDQIAAGRGVHIKRIVIAEKSRGMGREALTQLVRRAVAQRKAPFVWLDVLADNARAQAAYRAAGFAARRMSEAETSVWSNSVGGFPEGSIVMFCEDQSRA